MKGIYLTHFKLSKIKLQDWLQSVGKEHQSNLYSQCGWLSVAQLSVYHSQVLVFKVLATKSPRYLYEKLSGTQGETYYRTRFIRDQQSSQQIKLGPDSTAEGDIAKRSFKYRASAQWNSLPLKIRQSSNLKEFKFKLKKWVLSHVPIK